MARRLRRPDAAGGVPPARARLRGAPLTAEARPLERLFELEGLPGTELPAPLEALYGGRLGFPETRLVANFVATIDGVVAIPGVPRANRVISGDSAADRFVMGLLRAFADAVLVGSGTLAGSPRGSWLPEAAYPPAGEDFAELRRRLGRGGSPELAIVTATGSVDPAHPAVEAGALVVTTDQGAERLEGRLPAAAEVVSVGQATHVEPAAAVALLRGRGHRLVLSEAGPHLFGSLLSSGLVDELFLTVSPLLAGRESLDGRLPLVEAAHLLPDACVAGRLLSVRRDGAHLFLRYGFRDEE